MRKIDSMASPGQNPVAGAAPRPSPEYASAGWEGEGDSIPAFSLDSSLPGKYKTTVSNILSRHCSEVKTATEETIQPLASISKKKLKELITKHNNEIFGFMAKPDKTPQIIGLAETIFRRYGQDPPTIKGHQAGSILRDLNLNVSLDETVAHFDEGLKKNLVEYPSAPARGGHGGLEDYLKQTRWMFNQYKTIGEEVIRLETVLFQKIDLLDKLNSRTPLITSLAHNEVLPELIDTFSKYADSVYKSTKIEDTYKDLVETYKKWNICRQIISLHSNFKTESHEAQCAICLSEPVSGALVPCGHTFCSNCVKKQNTTCYICRGTIRERIKLFFT
jgi:hypothetical protein